MSEGSRLCGMCHNTFNDVGLFISVSEFHVLVVGRGLFGVGRV